MSQGIITLLTDFGTADPYVSAMKGIALSINPAVQLVDITHEVTPHDRFGHVEQRNTTPLERTEFSGSWAGRLDRFRTWLQRKQMGAASSPARPAMLSESSVASGAGADVSAD